jgi:hypothetical protein
MLVLRLWFYYLWMHGIHRRLILEFDHEMVDPLANGAVLRSLPPCYRRFVITLCVRVRGGIARVTPESLHQVLRRP